MWLNFDIGRTVFVTAGRQRVKWGIGRFWNPTDFLQPARLDALAFFDAAVQGRLADVERMMREFYVPYGRLRARQPGYAVSLPKAGCALVGRDAGPVRPPLSDPSTEERAALAALIDAVADR